MNSEQLFPADDDLSDEQYAKIREEKKARRQLLEPKIIALVNDPSYKPCKPRQIAERLGLGDDQNSDVRRTVKKLIKEGRLKFGPKHRVHPVKTQSEVANSSTPSSNFDDKPIAKVKLKPNEVIGVYRKTSRAFGFVTPSDYFGGDRAQDIFIPPRKELDASDGDTVRVRVNRERRTDRSNGRVLEVLKRSTHTFVGTYSERGVQGIVTVDGEQFDSPIWVGDAKAKNCRPGDKVIIDMVHFPTPHQAGEAVIVEVLGPRGTPGVDTQTIIAEFGLPGEFPRAAMQEAHRQAELFDDEDFSGRTDFTKKTIVTIDPKTARDFDDAISLERLDNGNWELGVHIADVAHFVQPGTALDDEAYQRGNSIYLPDKVIPMLPEIISNNLASLQPRRNRYTMSVLMEVTPEGEVRHTEWHRGVIKSQYRFTYEEIDDYLADDQSWRERLTTGVFELVRNMHSLAMPMRKRRMRRGSIDLILPEVSIDLDDDGRVAGAHVEEYTESHQVIEEFMLAANEAVAQKLNDLELFYMRRIHESPSEKKLRDLTEFVRHLGISCDSLESRFEIKRIVALSADMPERAAIHFAVLRSMQKAIYSPKEVGHYALASKNYCHFTSPIRRYPDLIIHRMVADLINGKKPKSNFEQLEKWGQHCSATEQRAEQAERELIKLKLLNFLADRIGSKLPGVITGVEAFGVFVQGTELPAEGLLPLELLPPDNYWFDQASRTLSGRRAGNEFRLGDRVTVVVHRVDPDRRQLNFALATDSRTDRSSRSKSTSSTSNRSTGQGSRSEKRPTRRNAEDSQFDHSSTSRKKRQNSESAYDTPRKSKRRSTEQSTARKSTKNASKSLSSKSKKPSSKKSGPPKTGTKKPNNKRPKRR
jgi:ribonuclease R